MTLLVDLVVKTLPATQETKETRIRSLAQEDALEKEMATHSSILAWKTPWTEEPGGLQSRGSQRVGHNCVRTHTPITSTSRLQFSITQGPQPGPSK